MPENNDASTKISTDDLVQGTESTIPRLKLSQSSYNGLWTASGHIMEECQAELKWPRCMATYKKMAKDATIAPALNLVEMAIARVPWSVKIPAGYEDELASKAEFIRQCMTDMDHSWGSFIRQASSFNRYGFAPIEKVYRKRLKRNGSKYDDGRIALASLPLIAQDTVSAWDWDEKGRKLSGLWQYTIEPAGKNNLSSNLRLEDEFIPRKKFLLIRNNPLKDNPEGESPLKSCWLAWKYKTNLEEYEATGVASDMRGFKVLKLNPRYMDPNASAEDVAVFEYYKNMMRNMHMGEQSGCILPSVKDDQGEEMVAELSLLSITGQKAYDVNSIINRYKNEIISSLMASQLILGQGGGGSFSLAESLQSISNMAIESKLIEIRDVLNHDLIPQLFALNGWDTTVCPYFDFGSLSEPDLDILSKFLQRTASVGLVRNDASTVNWIAAQANMPQPFKDVEQDQEMVKTQLTGYSSGAAEGLSTAGEGTSKSPAGDDDASTGNMENS